MSGVGPLSGKGPCVIVSADVSILPQSVFVHGGATGAALKERRQRRPSKGEATSRALEKGRKRADWVIGWVAKQGNLCYKSYEDYCISNIVMFLCFLAMLVLSNVASVADYGSDGVPPTGIVITALVTYSVPYALVASRIKSLGLGQGLLMGVLNVSIVLPHEPFNVYYRLLANSSFPSLLDGWCEPFDTYLITCDILNADGHFSIEQRRNHSMSTTDCWLILHSRVS
ncbi:hypothetical protein Tco_0898233 [Tanacetum coccineum]